jgi:hypothetical protein
MVMMMVVVVVVVDCRQDRAPPPPLSTSKGRRWRQRWGRLHLQRKEHSKHRPTVPIIPTAYYLKVSSRYLQWGNKSNDTLTMAFWYNKLVVLPLLCPPAVPL